MYSSVKQPASETQKTPSFYRRYLQGIRKGAGVIALLLFLAYPSLGWLAASKVLAIQRQLVLYDQKVTSVANGAYSIEGSAYDINGVVGAVSSQGAFIGILSPPTDSNPSTKTSQRTLLQTVGTPPSVGDNLSLQGNIWLSNPKEALNIDYEDRTYPTSIGDMKAWYIPGKNANSWTIGVHGIGADKNEMLRFVQPVHDAGNTMFVINYRNDTDNPASPDGRNNLGATEWQDLQAAVAYAKTKGATSIQLYGDSLGGSVVENYLRRAPSDESALVSKVILDSPALDWKSILTNKLQQGGYPGLIYYPTALALKVRAGIDIASISTRASDIKHRTLIIHSHNDKTVPQEGSVKLARDSPNLVRLVDFGDGGHLRSWNYDQTRYESTIKDFLAQ